MPKKLFKQLRLRFLELDYTQGEIARKIGLAPSTMTGRMSGATYFTAKEMQAMAKLLDIEPQDFCKYFFDGSAA